jgi:hypothetical protein
MRRFLRGFFAVDVVLALGVTAVITGTAGSVIRPRGNLENALTGAMTYYTDSDQSFIGLLTGTGNGGQATSTLYQIGTGLSYVSGTAAAGGRVVSVQTGGGGTWLELAAWAPEHSDCWLIFENPLKSNTGTTINGFLMQQGVQTYYGVTRKVPNSSTCEPGIKPSRVLTTGFPTP